MRARTEHIRLHEAFNVAKSPDIIYCASYQDGLIHAFERVLSRASSGDYSHKCAVAAQVKKYEAIHAENRRAGRFLDVAYIEGYINGLVYLLVDDEVRAHLPFYFVYGQHRQPVTFAQYKKSRTALTGQHKRSTALAERIVRARLGPGDDLHHTPFLGWEDESVAESTQ